MIPIVPFATWLNALEASAANASFTLSSSLEEMFKVNPALKLLEFYSSLSLASSGGGDGRGNRDQQEAPPARLDTKNTEAVSKGFRELEAVKPEWMEAWVRGWMEN